MFGLVPAQMLESELWRMKKCINNGWLLLALALAGGIGARLQGQTFTTLHSFTGGSDGANPAGAIALSGNSLYGTTWGGGSSGNGMVFQMNTDGTGFTNLHSFTQLTNGTNSDGANPQARVILSGTSLYGMTVGGGSSGNGTVFKVNTDGMGFRTLHSFSYPTYHAGGLVLSGDTLYGTTDIGGASDSGTVFAVNTDGTGFTNLHSFSAVPGYPPINDDGAYPLGPLCLVSNALYGTAAGGGSFGQGTVFALNTDGTGFTNLHSFTHRSLDSSGAYTNSDGGDPNTGLVSSGSVLYGSGNWGGTSGNGTLFKLNTDGTGFTTLYSFNGGNDGAMPYGELILSGDSLYGTTSDNVFKINTDGTEFTALHQFATTSGSGTNSDGVSPFVGVISSAGVLYGVAYAGGSSGDGTVFSIAIPPQLTIVPLADTVVLRWPTNATGFALQSATNLVSPVWTPVSPDPVVLKGENTVTNPISGTQQFYRLNPRSL